MFRRMFLKAAAVTIVLPALRWTAQPSEVDIAYDATCRYFDTTKVVYFGGIPVHYREQLDTISWTEVTS